MANTISAIKLPNNNTYNFKVFSNNIAPILTKTYQGTSYYATEKTHEAATWYFMKIKPNNWNEKWQIKMKSYCYCPNYSTYNSVVETTLTGAQKNIAYANWNNFTTAALQYLSLYPLSSTGFNAGKSHVLGFNIQTNIYDNANYYRNFKIEIYQIDNCTIELLDTPVLWANWPETTTNNYGTVINYNCSARGLQETGALNLLSASNIMYMCNIDVEYTGTETDYETRVVNSWDNIISALRNKVGNYVFTQFMGNLGLTGEPTLGRNLIWGYAYIHEDYAIGMFFITKYASENDNVYVVKKNSSTSEIIITKMATRSELDSVKTITTITTNPNILDVLTPASDITITNSNVSVRNKMVIIDCSFSQTSTTVTNRFTFKDGYKPDASIVNIAPIFMYSNNKVSDTVLFMNTTVLRMFGQTPIANQLYYFRLIYLIK